jgi:hypothetical protein
MVHNVQHVTSVCTTSLTLQIFAHVRSTTSKTVQGVQPATTHVLHVQIQQMNA